MLLSLTTRHRQTFLRNRTRYFARPVRRIRASFSRPCPNIFPISPIRDMPSTKPSYPSSAPTWKSAIPQSAKTASILSTTVCRAPPTSQTRRISSCSWREPVGEPLLLPQLGKASSSLWAHTHGGSPLLPNFCGMQWALLLTSLLLLREDCLSASFARHHLGDSTLGAMSLCRKTCLLF